jgi:hypothetical protein
LGNEIMMHHLILTVAISQTKHPISVLYPEVLLVS